jgi:hypothetical protein
MSQLADVINNGLVPDIFKMERAHDLLMAIGENAAVLNSKEAGNFGELFGAFQIALETEAILAVSRVYDKPAKRYPTRCIQRALDLLEQHSKEMPEIVEMHNTKLACQFMGEENAVLVALGQGREKFISSLVQYYRELLASDEVTAQIELLKNIRDKRLAHNESAEPLGPTWGALKSLISHAQNFVGILGWAFFGTIYVHEGKYFLSDDAKRPSLALARLSKQLGCK